MKLRLEYLQQLSIALLSAMLSMAINTLQKLSTSRKVPRSIKYLLVFLGALQTVHGGYFGY